MSRAEGPFLAEHARQVVRNLNAYDRARQRAENMAAAVVTVLICGGLFGTICIGAWLWGAR